MTARDITRLLDAVIFNIAIGNVDAHAKNYSILLGPGAPQLAPLYDLMSGLAWANITQNHAQAIGGQRRGRHIYSRHWRRMAEAAGLAARGTLQRVEQVTARLLHELSAAVEEVAAMAAGSTMLGIFAKEIAAHLQGQRLACGLSIGISGKPEPSDLKIVDPVFEPEFDLSEADDAVIGDPVTRSGLAKSLRGAGFPATAAAIAAPSGPSARAKSIEASPAPLRASRRSVIDQRNAAARAELGVAGAARFTIGDTKLVGREVTMVLPVPLTIDGATYRRAIIRQGVPSDLLGTIMEIGLVVGALPSLDPQKAGIGGIRLLAEGARGELRIGGSFASPASLC